MSDPNTSTQTKALTTVDEIRNSLTKMESQFKTVLPAHVSPERFVRVTMTAIQNEPRLQSVNRQSLYSELMKCATDGLIPDNREATVTIFGDQAKYLPMIGGILKKVRNSGELSSISSNIVFKEDKFRYWIDGNGEHIDHEPLMFGERGEAIGVYGIAKTKDGGIYIEVMDKAQVLAVKNVSKAKSGPWSGAFEHEMWRKTVIRRLSKRLPMSTDLEQVIQRDDDIYDLNPPPAPSVDRGQGPSRLREAIGTPAAEVLTDGVPI